MLAPLVSSLLAFTPLVPLAPPNLPHVASRSSLGLPMSLEQPELLVVALPQHGVVDMLLRQAVYAFRMCAGAGVEGAVGPSEQMRDVRMLLTASTVGTVRAAKGIAGLGDPRAWSSQSLLAGLQHGTMLLYHPLELSRWLLRVADRVAPALGSPGSAAVGAQAAAAFAASLWLVWIFSTGLLALRALRGGAAAPRERRMHTLRLRKLALDVPIATHFLLGGTLLPLAAVGALGFVSSFLGVRAALLDPAAPPPAAACIAVPSPLLRLRSRCSIAASDWGAGRLASPCATSSPRGGLSPRGACRGASSRLQRWPLR